MEWNEAAKLRGRELLKVIEASFDRELSDSDVIDLADAAEELAEIVQAKVGAAMGELDVDGVA
jgi:hypothetical protein